MRPLVLYIDNFSSAPILKEVAEAVRSSSLDFPANPSSSIHALGRGAADQVSKSRDEISSFIGCSPRELVFTSGATESNNIALMGTAQKLAELTNRRRILVSSIEHPAVLEPASKLDGAGFDVERIKCNEDGTVDLKHMQSLLDEDVLLVSVMLVNNETGTIQPIQKVCEIGHSVGAVVHSDAAQALGKIPVDVKDLGVDLMSMSAHKMGGPRGVGALYVKAGPSNFPISPIMLGGGQEAELRPGTLNTPGIVGFSEACKVASATPSERWGAIESLRDRIEGDLSDSIPGLRVNCLGSPRVPGGSSFSIPGVDAEMLVANLEKVVMSTGSACKSGAPSPSHVLEAIGLSREDSYCTLRFCLGVEVLDRAGDPAEIVVSDVLDAVKRISLG